ASRPAHRKAAATPVRTSRAHLQLGRGTAEMTGMSASTAQAPSAAQPAPDIRPRATIWIVYGVMGVLLVGYLALLASLGGHSWPFVDGWMVAGFELLAAGLCL